MVSEMGKGGRSPDAGIRKGDDSSLPPGMSMIEIFKIGDQTDKSGRLLREDSASTDARKKTFRAGVPVRNATCLYEDNRYRHPNPMNEAAMEVINEERREMFRDLTWLAGNYYEAHPETRGTLQGLIDVSHLGILVPSYLFNRGHDPVAPEGELPVSVAAILKACRGVNPLAMEMANDPNLPYDASSVVTAAEVVKYTNDRKAHIGTRRVCAASPRFMTSTIDQMLIGGDRAQERKSDGQLASLVPDFAILHNILQAKIEFESNLARYLIWRRELVDTLGSEKELEAATLFMDGRMFNWEDVIEAFMQVTSGIQERVNTLYGRQPVTDVSTLAEILKEVSVPTYVKPYLLD